MLQEHLNGVNCQPLNGLKFNRQPSKPGNFCRQPSRKAVIVNRQTVSRSFKSHYFSCLFWTASSQRIVLAGTTSFHVPKYTHFTVFFSNLPLNWHYNRLPPANTSNFKILMINYIDKNKKVNINFNSCKKFSLDIRQPSKALKFNR